MTEANFIVDSSGEATRNIELHIAEYAARGLPPVIGRIEVAKQEVQRARLAQRMLDMVVEGRILEQVTETTRREHAQELHATRLGKEDLELVISAGRKKRFAPRTSRLPRTSRGGKK